MKIREVTRYSDKLLAAVTKLLPQLNPGAEPITKEKLKDVLKSAGTHLFVLETRKNEIEGMLTLVHYLIPTGSKLWIEDVVVDESQRGKGLGKALMLFAIEFATTMGAKSIELTSRPSRIAANQLYKDLGFELRETNVYRYSLK